MPNNKIFFIEVRVLAIASILLVAPGTNLLSQAIDTRQVLILNTYDGSAAPYDRVTEFFTDELQRQFGEPIAFYSINLDARRNETTETKELVAQLLRNSYDEIPPDLVFAVGAPAIRFWIEYRDSISGQAPLIALIREGVLSPEDLRFGDIARLTQFSFTGVVDDLLQLRPGTSHVVMVFGSAPMERWLAAEARKELGAYSERLSIEFTNDMTLPELQARLEDLSEQSAVFFGIFGVDAAGVIMSRDLGLSIARSSSTAPIFGAFDTQLGEGIVGGRLMRLQEIGVDAAEAGAGILRGEPVRDAWKVFELSTPVYDWRELNRWGIDIDRLPVDSQIRHRPRSLWDQYSAWIILATTVIVAQSLLIASLVIQRRRRYAAELAQKNQLSEVTHLARVSTMGELTAALAHELNQPLAAILSNAQAAQRFLHRENPDLDELREICNDIVVDDKRAGDLMRRIRRLSKRGESKFEQLNINNVIEDACKLMSNDLAIKHIRLHTDLAPNLPALQGDPVQLLQVMLNLVINACHAMQDVDTHERLLTLTTQALDNTSIKITVTDTGHGIDVELQEKIFQPFYTTRDEGMGMGLAINRRIVESHGGRMWVENNPDRGATFYLTLPVAQTGL